MKHRSILLSGVACAAMVLGAPATRAQYELGRKPVSAVMNPVQLGTPSPSGAHELGESDVSSESGLGNPSVESRAKSLGVRSSTLASMRARGMSWPTISKAMDVAAQASAASPTLSTTAALDQVVELHFNGLGWEDIAQRLRGQGQGGGASAGGVSAAATSKPVAVSHGPGPVTVVGPTRHAPAAPTPPPAAAKVVGHPVPGAEGPAGTDSGTAK